MQTSTGSKSQLYRICLLFLLWPQCLAGWQPLCYYSIASTINSEDCFKIIQNFPQNRYAALNTAWGSDKAPGPLPWTLGIAGRCKIDIAYSMDYVKGETFRVADFSSRFIAVLEDCVDKFPFLGGYVLIGKTGQIVGRLYYSNKDPDHNLSGPNSTGTELSKSSNPSNKQPGKCFKPRLGG